MATSMPAVGGPAKSTNVNGVPSVSSTIGPSPSSSSRSLLRQDSIWDMSATLLEGWVQKSAPLHKEPTIAVALQKNLDACLQSLEETKKEEWPTEEDEDFDGDRMEAKKKKKRKPKIIRTLHDPYHLWLQAWKEAEKEETGTLLSPEAQSPQPQKVQTMVLSPEADDVPSTHGGKLAQLCIGGIVNALAAVPFGLVNKGTPPASGADRTNMIASAANLTEAQLLEIAIRVHRAVQTRVRADILRTTPLRIQDMLTSDLQPHEFASIRKRIYDTVVLGKGLNTAAAELEGSDLATAPSGGSGSVHDIEKFKKCNSCGNNDQSSFVLDRKNGDVICGNCGTVVSESIMHEGSQYRKFEGEVDRNHHGDAANPLYSNAHNMSTTLGGVSQISGAGMGGFGSGGGGGKRNLETILRNAHAYTELNVSQFGKTDRRTRVGYKDRQKKEAFIQMAHVGDALSLHEAVVQRAKELFAGFRDDRELVQQFKGVIAACLCEAFEQLSQEGKAILKADEEAVTEEAVKSDSRLISARAARRNELHHANLAGKGGLLIDFSEIKKEEKTAKNTPNSAATSPKTAEKPAAAWNLLDCRSWLLDASRRIAQQWVEERNKASNVAAQRKFPSGSLEELEGRLVEHSIALCEYLESEMQTRNTKAPGSAASAKRIHTPRVQDMSKLGIKWQHAHERGSGGKGGVGGSGTQPKGKAPGGDRTAGQLLILLTAKKLGSILKDPVAGEAFHKELRSVIGQQQTRKRKLMLEEATRQRLQQTKRKPWLQARIQA